MLQDQYRCHSPTMDTPTPQSPPALRASSPSPSTSPTPALFACPPLERSVSTASSASNFSARSSMSRSEASAARRRGYVRPQPTGFAESAKSRESVMSLGSITHLQHYFARTGLLDGKGGQLLSSKSKKPPRLSGTTSMSDEGSSDLFLSPTSISDRDSTYSSMRSSPEVFPYDQGVYPHGGIVESPIDERDENSAFDANDAIMLPPTVSTYQHRVKYVAPPPDLDELRNELYETLKEAKAVLKEAGKEEDEPTPELDVIPANGEIEGEQQAAQSPSSPKGHGWYEIQGMHILDLVTLAIRAAKMYYTAHDQPGRLSAIKSERKIRAELLGVLDVLRRMATRKFAGGMRVEERETMEHWAEGVESMLHQEAEMERLDTEERKGWRWIQDDWSGGERERELAFMKSFDPSPDTLPPWTLMEEGTELPTPFLKEMQNGLRLDLLHNEFVRKSRRPFGYISDHHTDTLKPYRCADNLRYWIKAAELRWEIVLKVDVMGVVYGQDPQAWKAFDEEILRWSSKVRKELTVDLQEGPSSKRGSMVGSSKGEDLREKESVQASST